ncbi:hypothetical protein E2C01_062299 [Portunus trituberculatus]|uniref:Uncharacterized protein n=1 Tax=Portunus trituberculatus TaxID=210409 RepID=A0A5B7HFQ1_PORTR|nr:hypothetical protein [Portunus trituberculatus]
MNRRHHHYHPHEKQHLNNKYHNDHKHHHISTTTSTKGQVTASSVTQGRSVASVAGKTVLEVVAFPLMVVVMGFMGGVTFLFYEVGTKESILNGEK